MGRKASNLFPFRGKMLSAYQIAKAYGIVGSAHLLRTRMLEGMTPEEAVASIQARRTGPRSDVIGGILRWEVDQLRSRIHVGDELDVLVYYATLGNDTTAVRVETCVVTGVYPHLVTLRRRCGLTTSKTYIDLLVEGVRT